MTRVQLKDGSATYWTGADGVRYIRVAPSGGSQTTYSTHDVEYPTIMSRIARWATDGKIQADAQYLKVGETEISYFDPVNGQPFFVVNEGGRSTVVEYGQPLFDDYYARMFIHPLFNMVPTDQQSWTGEDWREWNKHNKLIEDSLDGVYQPLSERVPHPAKKPGRSASSDEDDSLSLDTVYKPLSERMRHQNDAVIE